MEAQYNLIELSCPKCGASKAVNVPKSLFEAKEFGHIKIQVPQGAVCKDHVFIVFLDVKGRVIGYESIDLLIGDIQEEIKEEVKDPITLNDLINSLGFNCVAGLLHAKLFNYPSYLIMNNDGKVNLPLINKIFDGFIPNNYNSTKQLQLIKYDSDTFPISTYFYTLVQNQRKRSFLINPRKHIIQMPWDSELEFEKSILRSILENKDENEHLKEIAYQIIKFLGDIQFVVSILESRRKISKKELIKELKENLITSTITKNRVVEMKEFIRRRISPNIANKIKD